MFFQETPPNGMDFSSATKSTITYQDANSWIQRLDLIGVVREVMFKGNMFACDRLSKCKYVPIGSLQWLDTVFFPQALVQTQLSSLMGYLG